MVEHTNFLLIVTYLCLITIIITGYERRTNFYAKAPVKTSVGQSITGNSAYKTGVSIRAPCTSPDPNSLVQFARINLEDHHSGRSSDPQRHFHNTFLCWLCLHGHFHVRLFWLSYLSVVQIPAYRPRTHSWCEMVLRLILAFFCCCPQPKKARDTP